MSKRRRADRHRKVDTRRFVQIRSDPSVGVELASGRPWIGVDQQVGHGSADAMFALSDAQYERALVDGLWGDPFVGECWRGEHPDLVLFHPGSEGWMPPAQWLPERRRSIPPRVAGELWRHVDALGDVADGARLEISQALAGGTAVVEVGDDGVSAMAFRLRGDAAYPRPYALVSGLDADSSRERVREVLGDPIGGSSDLYAVEGDHLRVGFDGDLLAELVLERPAPRPLPDDPIRPYLAVLGEPEGGTTFDAVVGGTAYRRWASSSSGTRRLLELADGREMVVEDARVLSARVPLDALPGSRDAVHDLLGAPTDASGRTDLYRYDYRDLVLLYATENDDEPPGTPREVTTVLRGVGVSYGIHRWRSGEFTTFLDVLGRTASHPLVGRVRALPGARIRLRAGQVSEVTIGADGHRAERFAAFVDGMPAEPTRKDIPFGPPDLLGDHDDVRGFSPGWIRMHARDGRTVTTITVSQQEPRGAQLRPWSWVRDRDR